MLILDVGVQAHRIIAYDPHSQEVVYLAVDRYLLKLHHSRLVTRYSHFFRSRSLMAEPHAYNVFSSRLGRGTGSNPVGTTNLRR